MGTSKENIKEKVIVLLDDIRPLLEKKLYNLLDSGLIDFEKENNSLTILTEGQIANRDKLASLIGINQNEILPFMNHAEANDMNPNIHYKEGVEYQENCQVCVLAYEARRRGLSVTSKGYNANGAYSEYLAANTSRAWENPNMIKIASKKGLVSTTELFENTKEIGRYHVGYDRSKDAGHILVAESLKDGSLIFYAPQQYCPKQEINNLNNPPR